MLKLKVKGDHFRINALDTCKNISGKKGAEANRKGHADISRQRMQFRRPRVL
jgi:hypothetical protein